MDSHFSFLTTAQAELLRQILLRRDPSLLERVQHAKSLSRFDADEIMSILGAEFTDNLDDEWEPTPYGLQVNDVLAQFNVGVLEEWP
ncbi:hypothetical protein [Mycolicibacterium arenosum]|uniref:Nif11 domain-containing protein n=1 Tax=Mycolicibacterium arenosum TaxID=2952157 RepID=A0ABT1M736_9MYCO|nr:hypothetical protein [Mycolicibacterium sp. CAU 1645]MCP9274034.1 hypothetical protein [Mycolicibacterium sp. CAU 1645]